MELKKQETGSEIHKQEKELRKSNLRLHLIKFNCKTGKSSCQSSCTLKVRQSWHQEGNLVRTTKIKTFIEKTDSVSPIHIIGKLGPNKAQRLPLQTGLP